MHAIARNEKGNPQKERKRIWMYILMDVVTIIAMGVTHMAESLTIEYALKGIIPRVDFNMVV